MTDKEIEAYRKQLNEFTAQCSEEKPENRIYNELKQLARKVGASTCVFYVGGVYGQGKTGVADTSGLIRNIHQALQTASMANMCQTAAQGYEMATKASEGASMASKSASKQFWIAAAIAFLSAVAAWVAAFRN
jgi:hypothetical protein